MWEGYIVSHIYRNVCEGYRLRSIWLWSALKYLALAVSSRGCVCSTLSFRLQLDFISSSFKFFLLFFLILRHHFCYTFCIPYSDITSRLLILLIHPSFLRLKCPFLSYNKNQQGALISRMYVWNKTTCFGQFLCPSSGKCSMTYTIVVCTMKNSWRWTEELSETCSVLCRK